MRLELLLPLGRVDAKRTLDRFAAGLEAAEIEVPQTRHEADRRLHRARATGRAVDDPLEHAHVLAVARPQVAPVVALAEPVHQEDLRPPRHATEHREPRAEV